MADFFADNDPRFGARRERPAPVVGSPPIIRFTERSSASTCRCSAHGHRELVYGILNQSQRQRLETDLEIDFSYAVPGRARFRVNAYYQRPRSGPRSGWSPRRSRGCRKLNLPKSLNEWVNKPRGLVLVTGPTGSGKSTDARVAHQRDQRDSGRATS